MTVFCKLGQGALNETLDKVELLINFYYKSAQFGYFSDKIAI